MWDLTHFFLKNKGGGEEEKDLVWLFVGTYRMYGLWVPVLVFSSIFTPHIDCVIIGMFQEVLCLVSCIKWLNNKVLFPHPILFLILGDYEFFKAFEAVPFECSFLISTFLISTISITSLCYL